MHIKLANIYFKIFIAKFSYHCLGILTYCCNLKLTINSSNFDRVVMHIILSAPTFGNQKYLLSEHWDLGVCREDREEVESTHLGRGRESTECSQGCASREEEAGAGSRSCARS